ncbi:unnamed protein product, partial [Rotaria magnacalcarata]
MNEQLTTQTAPPPIVLKLKKYDDHNPDVINPHTFHISTETIDRGQSNSSSFIQNNERDSAIMTTSPGTLRVKLNTPFLNGCGADHIDEEYAELITLERVTRPAKRTQKSLSSDNASNN